VRHYELLYIIPSDVAETDINGVIGTIQGWIETAKGKVAETNNWGRRQLAYQIGTFREGTYILAKVEMPAEGLFEVERELRLSTQVLRHMFVRLE